MNERSLTLLGTDDTAIDFTSDSKTAYEESIGKVIDRIKVTDNALHIDFHDGSGLIFQDEEEDLTDSNRYMACDDELSRFVGTKFRGIEIRAGGRSELDSTWIAETQFMDVITQWGVFTICNYNDHNGYYGGFNIHCSVKSLS